LPIPSVQPEQVMFMHMPPMHVLPGGHAAQNAPPTPHCAFDVPG
jgi:hypothetical protein